MDGETRTEWRVVWRKVDGFDRESGYESKVGALRAMYILEQSGARNIRIQSRTIQIGPWEEVKP